MCHAAWGGTHYFGGGDFKISLNNNIFAAKPDVTLTITDSDAFKPSFPTTPLTLTPVTLYARRTLL